MKKRRFVWRLLALTTVAVMLLPTVPAMAAFRDTAGHWAEKTLTEWQEQGLIDGYSDGGFQPDGTMTRAGFAKLMNRGLGFTDEASISFTDVKESDWFYAEVAKAVGAGYAQGSGDTFRPRQEITRAQAAAMIARAAGLSDNETRAEAFTDAASIPAWAKGSIGAAAEAGFMNGYDDGSFRANSFITRAQAVVTLDRVRKDRQSMTIEKAGATLENKTVNGDLIIAASVGEGNVTLKNVTVRGNLIVKGGGANSVYLDGTKVNGDVQMQKENVHLHLMGDTALGRMEIGMPCRITQNSSFKGVLGAIVIDLERASSKKIQIEVPAKLVELLSRADVELNADVETLQIDKDAEGAQLEIKRGTMVGGLTADAKVELTGSGTVASLAVSVNGVTVSGSLSVKKTDTEDGAKAPTVSGGSSGSSGNSGGSGSQTLKEITGVALITAKVPYGTESADALAAIPKTITLNLKDGSTVQAAAAGWKWADGVTYSGTTAGNYMATTAFTVPSGYTYSGTTTATATVTVKALDTSTFDAALAAAQAKLSEFTVVDSAAKATDASKIYIVPDGTTADKVTKDVKFVLVKDAAAYTALKDAITKSKNAQPFATQADCNSLRDELTTATANADKLATQTGNAYTNNYIKAQIKNWLDTEKATQTTEWAISDAVWPLKYGHKAYTLPEKTNEMQLSAGGTKGALTLTWTITTTSWQDYLNIDSGSEPGVKSVRVTKAPDAPMEIIFKVSAAYNGTDYGEIGNYTATIGAPIQVNTAASVTAPKMTSSKANNISVHVPLTGANYITGTDTSKITVIGDTSTSLSITAASITKDGRCTVNNYRLSVPVTATCGAMGVTPAQTNTDGTPKLNYSRGKIKITIPSGALTVDESSGWYAPAEALTYDAEVWGCNPAATITTRSAGDGKQTVSVQIEYAYKNFIGAVAYTKTNDNQDAVNTKFRVTFDADDWKKDESGQDLITCTKANVPLALEKGITYYIWYNFDSNGNFGSFSDWANTGMTIQIPIETP